MIALASGFMLGRFALFGLCGVHAAKTNYRLATPSAVVCSNDEPARVFVGTMLGEIAAIKMDGGWPQWQNKDHQDRSSMKILKVHGNALIGASEGGTVHVMDAHSGKTQWERGYNDRVLDFFPHGPDAAFNTVVVHESGIQSRTFDGEHKWGVFPAALGKPTARFVAAAMAEDQSELCAIANDTDAGEPAMFAVSIDSRTGKVKRQETLPEVVSSAVGSQFIVAGQHLVYVEKETLSVYPICGSGVADTYNLRPHRLKPHLIGSVRLLPWEQTRNVFAMTNNASTFIFRISDKELKLARSEDAPGVVGVIQETFSSVSKAEDHVAIAMKRGASYDVKFVNVETSLTEREREIKNISADDHGVPWYVAACGHGKDLHINMIAQDHTLVSVKGVKPAWTLGAGHADVKRTKNEHPMYSTGHHEL